MNAVAARLLAILEAQTAEFDARMTASAGVVDKMTRSQTVAARAAGQVRTGLQGLANQAFATAGPLGQVASGLSQIVGGAAALTGAAAGGALFLWFNHLTKELEAATAKADELGATFRRMAAARIGSPLLARLAEREPFEQQAADIQSKMDARVRSLAGSLGGAADPVAMAHAIAADDKLSELQRQLDGVNGILDEVGRKPEIVLLGMRREIQLLNAPLEETLRLQAEWAGLVGKTADEFVRLGMTLAMHPILKIGEELQEQINDFLRGNAAKGITPFALSPETLPAAIFPKQGEEDLIRKARLEGVAGLGRGLGKDDLSTSIINQLVAQEQQRVAVLELLNNETFMAQLAAQGLTEEFTAMVRGMNRAEIKSQQLAVAIVSSVTSAIQAIASGGGPGAVISGAGSIMTAAAIQNPALLVPGMLVSAFGSLISVFDRQHSERERNEERRKNELIGAIREGPLRETNIFVGDPEMGRYQRDRDDRLGGGPSRMGV